MGVHDKHRERLKERFLREGLDHFSPHMVLELLLFYCIPRKDTNEIGHALMARFGSLEGVFNASVQELVQIPGISGHSATLLTMIPQLARRYQLDRQRDINLSGNAQAGAYLVDYYMGKQEEEVVLLGMDAKRRLLGTFLIHKGGVNSAEVSVRKVLRQALECNAVGVILAHNHPGGVALPSPEDLVTTQIVERALEAAGIELSDHIIVAGDDYVSLAQSGKLGRGRVYR